MRLDIVIDDRLVAQRRADHAETLGAQATDQAGEAFLRYDSLGMLLHCVDGLHRLPGTVIAQGHRKFAQALI